MNYERIRRAWRLATSAGHVLIAAIAIAASEGYIKPSNTLLAILIAWANTCTAIHHGTDDFNGGSK